MTRTTTHVTYFATACDAGGEAIEQFSVEGLGLKFVDNSTGILFRKAIVASTNRLCDVGVHTMLRNC